MGPDREDRVAWQVCSRTTGGEPIFAVDQAAVTYLRWFDKALCETRLTALIDLVMPNHVHWLLLGKRAETAQAVQLAHSAFAR